MGRIQDIQNYSSKPKKARESIREYLHRIGDETGLPETEIDELATAIERDCFAESYTWSESDSELFQRLRRDLRQNAEKVCDTPERTRTSHQSENSTNAKNGKNSLSDASQGGTVAATPSDSDTSSAESDTETTPDVSEQSEGVSDFTDNDESRADGSGEFDTLTGTVGINNWSTGVTTESKFLAFVSVIAAIEMIIYVGMTSEMFTDFWFFYDAREVWIPNAEAVLSSDTGLYQSPATDNKPPLWQYLNLAGYASGHYATVMFSLVAAANAIGAFLLFQYVSGLRGRSEVEGMIAGSIYLFAVPALNGLLVNVRSFAIVGLLLALIARRGWITGIALSAGGLFSQFAVLAAPVFIARKFWRRDFGFKRWFVEFTVAGCGLAVLSFLPLFYWGSSSVENGIEASILYADEYIVEHPARNPLEDPWAWATKLHDVGQRIYWLLVPSFLMLIAHARGVLRDDAEDSTVVAVLCVLFLSTLFIKSLTYYWLFPALFMAILVARGIVVIVQREAGMSVSQDQR